MGMKSDRIEINAFIENDKCDVLLSGTPDGLINCLSSIVKAIAIRLAEEAELKELQKSMGVSDDIMHAYLTLMVMNETVDSLDNIGNALSHLEFEDSTEEDLEDIKEKFLNGMFNTDNATKIESDMDLDFDVLSEKTEDENE